MAIAIAGRPNVGKSSLFNRLIGRRKALVWNRPGVTRDILRGEWKTAHGDTWELWDMAGWDRVGTSLQNIPKDLKTQIDAILLVIDGSQPLTSEDRNGFQLLRKMQRPIVIAVNKADKRTFRDFSTEIFEEFQNQIYFISAERGEGLVELEEAFENILKAKKSLPQRKERDEITSNKVTAGTHLKDENMRKVLVLGRPNVGKSSLLNQISKESIAVVSDQAGTTRDTVESKIQKGRILWTLKDSAGIRKKGKIYGRRADPVEIFSAQFALKEILKSDFAIFVVEANHETVLHSQDKKLLHLVRASLVPTIIVVNKWDLFKKSKTEKDYREELKHLLGDLQFLPILFVSAKTGFHIDKIFQILENMNRCIRKYSTSRVNHWLQASLKLKAPRVARKGVEKIHGGKTQTQYLNLTYALQTSTRPMIFQIFCNAPQAVAAEDKRFLERTLRDHFQLQGIPLKLIFRKKT